LVERFRPWMVVEAWVSRRCISHLGIQVRHDQEMLIWLGMKLFVTWVIVFHTAVVWATVKIWIMLFLINLLDILLLRVLSLNWLILYLPTFNGLCILLHLMLILLLLNLSNCFKIIVWLPISVQLMLLLPRVISLLLFICIRLGSFLREITQGCIPFHNLWRLLLIRYVRYYLMCLLLKNLVFLMLIWRWNTIDLNNLR
jgi:hypothetical protein